MVSRAGQASRVGVTSLGNMLVLGLMNFPLLRALALPLSTRTVINVFEDDGKKADDPTLWIYLAFAFTLVILGGIFAGLTIAYVNLKQETTPLEFMNRYRLTNVPQPHGAG